MRAKRRPQYRLARCKARQAEAEFLNMQKGILAPTYPQEGLKGFARLTKLGVDEEILASLYSKMPNTGVIPTRNNLHESAAYQSLQVDAQDQVKSSGRKNAIVDHYSKSRTAKSFPRRTNINYTTIQSKNLKMQL